MLDSNQIAQIPEKIQDAWITVCNNFEVNRFSDKETILAELYHQIRIAFADEYNDGLVDILTDYAVMDTGLSEGEMNEIYFDIIIFSRNEDITLMPSENVDSNGVYAVINFKHSAGGEMDDEFLVNGLSDLATFTDIYSPTDAVYTNVSLPSEKRVIPYFKYFLGINADHRTADTFIAMQKTKDDDEFERL